MPAHRSSRILSCLLLATLLSACGGGSTPDATNPTAKQKTPTSKLAPKSFRADCSDFLDYTAAALTEQYLTPLFYFLGPPVAGAPTAAPAEGAAPDRTSGTTVQEAGVDEADVVKVAADGTFFIVRGHDLLVLRGTPASGLASRPIKSLPLADGNSDFFNARELFLDENSRRLVVMAESFGSNQSHAVNVIFDITDTQNPVELARLTATGYSLEARRIASRIHRVLRYELPLPSWFYDSNDALVAQRDRYNEAKGRNDSAAADRIKADIRTEISRRVSQQGASSFLPTLSATVGAARSERTLACNEIQHPEVTTATGLALVDSFDSTGSNRSTTGLINNAFLVYASAQNLYLAQTSNGWFFAPNQADETVIYRLSLSADNAVQHEAIGKVDGYIPNRFALSEFAGALRVASTENRLDGERSQSYTHLSLLKADSRGEMSALGSVRDLAPGEQLRSARFIGDRGFLVTFRQVDPLFAFDLANPAQPRLLSALKIPGFSSYIEPLGRDYLLTVGRAGDEERLNGQVAIQLFDVRDLSQVRLLSSLSPPAGNSSYSYSPAEYEPHAFTYFADSAGAAIPGTLSLPLQTYGESQGEQFSGFMTVRVDPTGGTPLSELGRVDHREFADTQTYCPRPSGGAAPANGCFESVTAADPLRSVFAQSGGATTLFTISSLGLKANDAARPATEQGKARFPAAP